MSIRIESVIYRSEGLNCTADIYHPEHSGETALPALVVTQGFCGVKEISKDVGEFYASHGYRVMAIDYRSFGGSEGTPRGELFPLRQVEDMRNALTFLEGRSDVDSNRIGLWGTSFSGGVVLYAAALDRRFRLVISQIPVVDGQRWHKALRTTVQYAKLLDTIETDRRDRYAGLPARRIPVTGYAADEIVAMPADKEINDLLKTFTDTLPTWSNDVTLESVEKIIEYTPLAVIDRIAPRPLLMIAVAGYDISHPASDIVDAFERAREPKKLLVFPYSQLELYYGEGLQLSLTKQLDFVRDNL